MYLTCVGSWPFQQTMYRQTDKHSSLLQKLENYSRLKLYNIGPMSPPWANVIKLISLVAYECS
jgi:hypothetical protein